MWGPAMIDRPDRSGGTVDGFPTSGSQRGRDDGNSYLDYDSNTDSVPSGATDSTVNADLDYDAPGDQQASRVAEARAAVDDAVSRGERIILARDAVAAADPASSADQAVAYQDNIDSWLSPRPSEQVEETDLVDPVRGPGAIREVAEGPPDARELKVITDAQADLSARRESGSVLGGDPIGRAELWHEQGRNNFGYRSDCALAASSEILQDCGVPISENDTVAQAVDERRCETGDSDPAYNGSVYGLDAVRDTLADYGVESEIRYPQNNAELAHLVEEGHGVATLLNCGELWDGRYPDVSVDAYSYDSQGRAETNHAVQVTGTVRDRSGELTGFVINDTGVPDGAGQVIPTATWDRCWGNTNRDHETVATTCPTLAERAKRS